MSHHIVWGEGAWAEEKEGFICINGLVLQKLEGISRRLESDYLEGFSIWAFGGGSCIIKERQRQINPVGFPVVQDKMEPVQIYFIQRTIWNIVNFRNDTNLGYICKKKKRIVFGKDQDNMDVLLRGISLVFQFQVEWVISDEGERSTKPASITPWGGKPPLLRL